MTTNSGVIQRVDAGFFTAAPKANPSRVYVVSYRDGRLRSFSGAPSATDRITAKFCFLVDTSEQHAAGTCTATSAVDAYSFSVELSATWRVTDPEAAVRADLSDGGALVLRSLEDVIWQIARGFGPDRAAAAEGEARARLGRPFPLEAGVTVVRAAARFRADAAVTSAITDTDSDLHKGNLERQRMARLREMFDGTEAGALMLHMLAHPDDTGTALNALREDRDKEQALRLTALAGDRQHYLAMLDRALEHKLINEDDAQPLRDLLFGQAAGAALAGSATMVPIAPRPALFLPRGISAGAPPAAVTPAPAGAPPAAAGPGEPAAPPVAQGFVIEDGIAGDPAEEPGPGAPGPAAPASPGPAAGGVAGWKEIRRTGGGTG